MLPKTERSYYATLHACRSSLSWNKSRKDIGVGYPGRILGYRARRQESPVKYPGLGDAGAHPVSSVLHFGTKQMLWECTAIPTYPVKYSQNLSLSRQNRIGAMKILRSSFLQAPLLIEHVSRRFWGRECQTCKVRGLCNNCGLLLEIEVNIRK